MTIPKKKALEKALENCASEPIHKIGSIQPHGALLVLNPDNDYKVVQASENISDFISLSHNVVLGSAFATLADKDSFNRFITMTKVVEKHNTATEKLHLNCQNVWQEFDVHLYKSDSLYVLELNPNDGNHNEDQLAKLLLEMQKSEFFVCSGINSTEYLDKITRLVRELTGYDSVMVYRFEDNWNGEVICQSRVEASPSYLGMHFPASDIPAQARRLYTINLVRILANVDDVSVAIIPPVFNVGTDNSLDMSYSALRSLSPIHIEYLRNIGVKASMSISLLQGRRLWGLIVCHHNSPKPVSIAMREAAIFISQLASEKITHIENMRHKMLVDKATQLSEELFQSFIKSPIKLAFQEILPKLQSLLNATGIIALINDDNYCHGNVPSALETQALLEWLAATAHSDRVFSCSHLEKIHEPASNYRDIASGLLAVSLFGNMKNCIVWFRAEKIRTIQWAGKYEEGFVQNDVGDFRLTPRKSFDLWTELSRGQSQPWCPIEDGVSITLGSIVSNAFSHVLQQTQSQQNAEWQIMSIAVNKKTQENLDKLTSQLPGVLYQFKLFPDGRSCFPYASKGLYNVFEIMPHQIFTDSAPVFSVLHPNDYDMIVNSIKQSAQKLETWKMEYRVNLPKKGLRWHSAVANPEKLDDGSILWHGYVFDITSQKAIRNERERLLKIIDDSPDFIGMADMNANLKYLNLTTKKLAGLPNKFNVSNLKIKDMHPEWATNLVLNEGIKTVLEHGFWKGETALLNNVDNTEIPVSQMITAHYDKEGKPEFLSSIMRDISKEKEIEKQLLEAKEAAEAAVRAKSEFIANISHEIRTPMNAILGFSDILSTLIIDPTNKYYLDAIKRSGKTLLQLLNDTLDLSKMEVDKITLRKKSVSLEMLLDDINVIFSQQASQKSVRFSVSIDEKLPRYLLLDEIRLRQILLNLCSNALKFTRNGGIEVKASVLYIDTQNEKMTLLIDIADSGIGIPEAEQEKIFSAFTQQENQSVEYGGTGLGLTICKKLLHLMGGHIFVNSVEGVGSHFSIILIDVLICSVENEVKKNKIVIEESPIKQIKFEPAKILLVDDVTINRELVRAYLAEFNELSFIEVSTGEEALSMAQQHSFDLIFMDKILPDIDGNIVCQQMKAINPHIPIIMISASIGKEESDTDPTFYDLSLSKPVNKNALLKSICIYLKSTEIELDNVLDNENESHNIHVVMDSDQLSELLTLLAVYQVKFRSSNGFNVSFLVEIAKELVQLADQYHCLSLKEWAKTLGTQADLFDISNLNKTLSYFDTLYESIASSGNITR